MREEIMIDGIPYPFNPEKEDFIDGHVFCKICKERLDNDPIKLFNERYIFSRNCRCEREKVEAYKRQQYLQEVERLKEICFKSPVQGSYRFQAYQGEKSNAYITALNYARQFEEMQKDNIGLIFFGPVGSGKSFLASCIANYLIEEYQIMVKMQNFAEIINELQSGGFDLDRNKYIESITKAPLLILDDLGIERDTPYAKEQVYNVINSRYLKQRPTIITTNLPWTQILNSNGNMEYQRIYSRIVEMCIPVKVEADDYRRKINERKMEKYRNQLTKEVMEDD